MSETDTCRSTLEKYCTGYGLDIGHGNMRPIKDSAICIESVQRTGDGWPTHLSCDAFTRLPFDSETFDYVFSSHCLEDAKETAFALKEWVRVLKVTGKLVLFLPDQATYEQYCRDHNAEPNGAHVHKNFSMEFVEQRMPPNMKIVVRTWPFPGNAYSFALVAYKVS